jgi:uncharacterized protein YqgV (UPF0045/DUF77 family)
MSVLIHFSIFPTDKQTSASPYVARAVRIIRDSGLNFTPASSFQDAAEKLKEVMK